MKQCVGFGAMLGVAVLAGSASASITVYSNDFAGWSSAVTSFNTETFAGNVLTQAVNGLSVTSSVGTIGGNVNGAAANEAWNDRVVSGGASTTWSFANPATAFGGDWDLTPGGPGQGLMMTIELWLGGTMVAAGEIPNSFSGQFWGFTSTDSFDQVRITGGTQNGVAETYSMDNLVFNAIPLPPETAMAGLGLLGLAGIRVARRRRG